MPTASFIPELPTLSLVHVRDVIPATFSTFISTETKALVGIAASYRKSQLDYVALATTGEIVVIHMWPVAKRRTRKISSLSGPSHLGNFLAEDNCLVGFNVDRLAVALFHDAGLRIRRGVDLQSALKPSMNVNQRFVTAASLLPNHLSEFEGSLENEESRLDMNCRLVAERALASLLTAQSEENVKCVANALPIDTTILGYEVLGMLAKTTRDQDRLDALKPTRIKNDFSKVIIKDDGNAEVYSIRFKTKLRGSGINQTVILDMGKGKMITARAKLMKGKRTTIATDEKVVGTPWRIHTFGKDDPTGNELQRRHTVKQALQNTICLDTNPLVNKLWFQHTTVPSPVPCSKRHGVTIPLNHSQSRAVDSMLSEASPTMLDFVLVQGPPGTGKTSVITGVVQGYIASGGKGLWLVAQSNVAVKNMAEKLGSIGFFDWKLLVSKDFHFEWHEHLYERLERNVVVSSDFSTSNIINSRRLLGGAKVILCTLSMLTSARVGEAGFHRLVPVDMLVIDEASQIELGDYLSAFVQFSRSLRKVGFVGDDEQHRMPPAIGNFISKNIYAGHLLSNPEHPVLSNTCCRFVEVAGGEEKKVGYSWENVREAELVVHLVRQLVHQGRTKNFRVITPYEAQQNRIEVALKVAGLPWEDKCFALDSFQGNEADYIIISVVRTVRPGFLQNKRRTNVMLTRCKKGMAILSQKQFLTSDLGRDTLVGQLAAEWSAPWITAKEVLNNRRVFD